LDFIFLSNWSHCRVFDCWLALLFICIITCC